MKLIVNIDCLIPPLTGVGRYAQGILRELVKHPAVEDVRAFSSAGRFSRQQLQHILDASGGLPQTGHSASPTQSPDGSASSTASFGTALALPLRTPVWLRVAQRMRPLLASIPGARALRRSLRAYSLRRATRALSGYVYWEPNYLLAPYEGDAITVVHDLSHLRYPQHHPQSRLDELDARLLPSLLTARAVVAVSEFTRSEMAAYFPQVTNVHIVPPAVDDAFFSVTQQQAQAVAERYRLPSRFVLSVATLEPRKNLLALLEAWSGLPADMQRETPLVLVGTKGWLNENLSRRMDALESQGLVRYLGYVPQADMAPLLACATVLAYVSVYEGFGMPVAEAMAAGTAVLTSNVASMPEVAGDAACLVDPHKVDSIREGLSRLLTDHTYRQLCEAKGRERAQRFTWAASAQALMNVVAGLRDVNSTNAHSEPQLQPQPQPQPQPQSQPSTSHIQPAAMSPAHAPASRQSGLSE